MLSGRRKCLMDEIQFDDKLHMIEESVEIIDREIKWLSKVRYISLKFVGIRKEVQNFLGNMRRVMMKRGRADKSS
ncbi:hypothetical protein Tco_0728314 [Tanacetum coccineum]|uniref:Uncharacterized protein n=1 Tax=Tanacetum coccineum TaxID=301880 RepID=A0ABQ4YKT3_9ASTR